MPGRDLERTRTDLQVHREMYPAGARLLQGERRDLEDHIRQSGARAVGVWRPLPGGGGQIPVVYVSKRARAPFYIRHRVGLIVAGGVLMTLSGLALLVAWVGWAWFIGGALFAGGAVATLVRWSRGGGGGSVSVTTTTTVKVRR